jgi:hypothetical protein
MTQAGRRIVPVDRRVGRGLQRAASLDGDGVGARNRLLRGVGDAVGDDVIGLRGGGHGCRRHRRKNDGHDRDPAGFDTQFHDSPPVRKIRFASR